MKKRKLSNTRFNRFVKEKLDTSLLILPLVHTTTAHRFAEILPNDQLIPVFCKNFNEELIYLFYGRPAYRPPDGVNSNLEFNWPVVMIFDHKSVGKIERIFPFDTGAFLHGLYSQFFHQDSKIDDFELTGNIYNAAAIADIYYTTTQGYLFGRSDRNIPIEPMQFEVQGLQELSRIPGISSNNDTPRRDERSSSIEIQVGGPINLTSNLLAIILPQKYMGLPPILDALERWEPDSIRYYEPVHNLGSESVSGEIYRIVKDVYQENNIL